MSFEEFLKLCVVLKTLYGRAIASEFFEKNIDTYYNLNYADFSASQTLTQKAI